MSDPASKPAPAEPAIQRCSWPLGHDDYLDYHDNEWGRPTTDPHRLFEKICLEGFQSGLSWLTILRKRDEFRNVFAGFDYEKVARFGEKDVVRLLDNAGIIRHRGKIEATINNAKQACEMADQGESLVDWIWSWAVLTPDRDAGPDGPAVPASTERSKTLAKELKKMGWKFFGPTTAYAFMQSEGLTNDHDETCFAHQPCEAERAKFLAGRELRQL